MATTARKVGRENRFRKMKVSVLLIGATAPDDTVLGGPLRGHVVRTVVPHVTVVVKLETF